MKIKTLQEKEYDLIMKILKETDWNLEQATRLLQIPISQLKRKIKKHNIKKVASGGFIKRDNDMESES